VAAYASSIDALHKLLTPASVFGSCHITNITQDIRYTTNGVEYCAVEVTCDDNVQYGIQAYGEEAIELYREALELSEKKQIEGNEKVPLLYSSSQ
jgi:hypothetical protein